MYTRGAGVKPLFDLANIVMSQLQMVRFKKVVMSIETHKSQ